MSKRKPNNTRARLERASRALLRTNHVGVINIDPHGGKGLIHMLSAKKIVCGSALVTAINDIPHQWTIYLSAFCLDQRGERYIKSVEIATPGIHMAGQLTDVIAHHYRGLMETCNRRHLIGIAWIANPCGVSLSEEQAAHIYDVTGAWAHVERTKAA